MSPDGSKIPSPEEKLLRLIRGKGAAPTPPVGGPSAAPTEVVGARSAAAGPGTSHVPGSRMRGWKAPAWSLAAINVALGCLAVGLLMAVALVALAPSPANHATIDTPVEISPSERPERDASPPAAPATPLSAAAARPLFVSPPSPGGASAPLASVPLSQQAKELAGRLSVLGIVEGEPRQAIIEDSQTKKTYFVSAGQQVVEGMVVAEVRTDRVILDLDGQRLELSL